jgi:hypothetical protein
VKAVAKRCAQPALDRFSELMDEGSQDELLDGLAQEVERVIIACVLV